MSEEEQELIVLAVKGNISYYKYTDDLRGFVSQKTWFKDMAHLSLDGKKTLCNRVIKPHYKEVDANSLEFSSCCYCGSKAEKLGKVIIIDENGKEIK